MGICAQETGALQGGLLQDTPTQRADVCSAGGNVSDEGTSGRAASLDLGPGGTVPGIAGGRLSPLLPRAKPPTVKGAPRIKNDKNAH